MPSIIYIEYNGTVRQVAVPIGHSVMAGAVENDVAGIDADCGGECACGTCQVYIDADWRDRIGPPPAGSEEAVLLSVSGRRRPESRLSCQMEVSGALEGLVVHLPESQR